MAPQDQAMLSIWQLQRAIGIKPAERRLPPANDPDSFERDLEVIRRCLEGK